MDSTTSHNVDKQPLDAVGFVFIGPSGSGKSTLREEICKQVIDGHSFVPFHPVTSRQRRTDESEYIFVDDIEFDGLLDSGDILFSNTSYGNRFLTPWPRALGSSQHYIYIYLPEAAQKIKTVFPNTKIIQIIPPDLSVIEGRIKARDSEIDEAELARRLSSAETEIIDGRQIADLVFVNELPIEQSAQLLSAKIHELQVLQ